MTSVNNLEKFKARVESGQMCIGTAITFNDAAVSELYGDIGYDFSWIDMEHGPFDLPAILSHIMAARGTGMAPFVRVPSNDPVLIKPVLDMVPGAIIVPMIKTPEDACQAVRACRYPPKGIRGYSPRRGTKFGAIPQAQYLEFADEQTMVFIQIEQIEAVKNIDAILQTPGLDGICLGPNDLSGSMDKLGHTTDIDVMAAIDSVLDRAAKTNLLLGVATGYDPQTFPHWMDRGIQWICLNTDYSNMCQHSKMILDAVRQTEKARPKQQRHARMSMATSSTP